MKNLSQRYCIVGVGNTIYGKNPVYIEGIGQGHPAYDFYKRPDMATSGAKISGAMAFESAGMKPADIDFCQIYDCFTIVPIITLEEYGFVDRARESHLPIDAEVRATLQKQ